MSKLKLQIHPPVSPEAQALFVSITEMVGSRQLAHRVLEKVQQAIDGQTDREEHEALVGMLDKIFTAITTNTEEDPYDLGGYFVAIDEMIEKHFAGRVPGMQWSVQTASDQDLGFFVWLRDYQNIDPEVLAEDIFEAAEHNEPINEESRAQCATFIAEAFKSILVDAKNSKIQAAYWTNLVDKMLDDLHNSDFFGTEGQRDPRGDRRG